VHSLKGVQLNLNRDARAASRFLIEALKGLSQDTAFGDEISWERKKRENGFETRGLFRHSVASCDVHAYTVHFCQRTPEWSIICCTWLHASPLIDDASGLIESNRFAPNDSGSSNSHYTIFVIRAIFMIISAKYYVAKARALNGIRHYF